MEQVIELASQLEDSLAKHKHIMNNLSLLNKPIANILQRMDGSVGDGDPQPRKVLTVQMKPKVSYLFTEAHDDMLLENFLWDTICYLNYLTHLSDFEKVGIALSYLFGATKLWQRK